MDSIGVCFCRVETVLDRVGSGDGCTECLDQFLDQLVGDITPDILDLCLGENRIEHSDQSRRRSQRTITGTLIPKLPFQALDLSLTAFQIGLGLLQGNGIVLPRSARLDLPRRFDLCDFGRGANLFSGHGLIDQLIGLGRIELLKLQDRIEFRASIETSSLDFLNALDLATPCITLDAPFTATGLGRGIHGEPSHPRGLVANLATSLLSTTGAAFFSGLRLGMDVLKNLLALMRMFRALSRGEIIALKILIDFNEQ